MFLFNPPINLSAEEKSLLGVTAFEATNSVFNIGVENNTFNFQHQALGLAEEVQKLQTDYKICPSIDFKLILKTCERSSKKRFENQKKILVI